MLLISGDPMIWNMLAYTVLGESFLKLASLWKIFWGFYRQHTPYLVVLFQSIYRAIINISALSE